MIILPDKSKKVNTSEERSGSDLVNSLNIRLPNLYKKSDEVDILCKVGVSIKTTGMPSSMTRSSLKWEHKTEKWLKRHPATTTTMPTELAEEESEDQYVDTPNKKVTRKEDDVCRKCKEKLIKPFAVCPECKVY